MEYVSSVLGAATFWDWQRLALQLIVIWFVWRASSALNELLRAGQADRVWAEIVRLRVSADELAIRTAAALDAKDAVVSDLKEAATTVKTEISDKLDVLGQKIDASADSSAKALSAANTFNEKLAATLKATDASKRKHMDGQHAETTKQIADLEVNGTEPDRETVQTIQHITDVLKNDRKDT